MKNALLYFSWLFMKNALVYFLLAVPKGDCQIFPTPPPLTVPAGHFRALSPNCSCRILSYNLSRLFPLDALVYPLQVVLAGRSCIFNPGCFCMTFSHNLVWLCLHKAFVYSLLFVLVGISGIFFPGCSCRSLLYIISWLFLRDTLVYSLRPFRKDILECSFLAVPAGRSFVLPWLLLMHSRSWCVAPCLH